MKEHEYQQLKSAIESREAALESLDIETGDPVMYDGEAWMFLEVRERDQKVVLEKWDDMVTVSPTAVTPK